MSSTKYDVTIIQSYYVNVRVPDTLMPDRWHPVVVSIANDIQLKMPTFGAVRSARTFTLYVPVLSPSLFSEWDGLSRSFYTGPVRIRNFTRIIKLLFRICRFPKDVLLHYKLVVNSKSNFANGFFKRVLNAGSFPSDGIDKTAKYARFFQRDL